MHELRRRSALILLILLAAVAVAAHAGGQEREASRGQRVPSTFGAKVVTEHVPVLPIPGLWRVPPRPRSENELATRMGFRAVTPTPGEPTAPSRTAAPLPTPPVDRHLVVGRIRLAVGDYTGAADAFRLSARANDDDGDPLLELGIALMATGSDEFAARTLRKAFRVEPELLSRAFDPAALFRDSVEFDRVVEALEMRAAVVPGNADAKFCLAVVRLYRKDARCVATFRWLIRVTPEDEVAKRCRDEAERRFTKTKDKSPARSPARREGVEK